MLLEGFYARAAADDPPELITRAAELRLDAAGRVRLAHRRVDAPAVTIELARVAAHRR